MRLKSLKGRVGNVADFPALPLWTDAYLADTIHLTEEQHGIYMLLLMHCWRAPRCRIPDDDGWIALRFKRPVEWVREHVRPIVKEFFTSHDAMLSQKRLSKEFKYITSSHLKRVAAAKRRWDKEKASNNASSNAYAPTPTPIEEREERKEDNNTVLKGRNGVYAFQHGCVKLTEEQLEKWRGAFPHLSVTGELIAGEPWLVKQRSWFNAAAGLLAKRERDATRPPEPKPAGPRRGSMLGNRS